MRAGISIAAMCLGGCSLLTDSFQTDDFSGDPFPIQVDTSTGAVMLGLRQAGHADRTAVLDLMSPITIADGGPDVLPSVANDDLDLLGANASGQFVVPRAHLNEPRLITLHPCNTEPCIVGADDTARLPYDALIGGDVMAGDAVRLQLADDEIFILASVAGDETHRARFCDAVFPQPYRGGGTMIIGGTELGFGSLRPVIGACLAPNPDGQVPQSQRGADILFVASTSVGRSLLSESAYERYRQEQALTPAGAPPELATLPVETVTLPSGPVTGHVASVPSIALVASANEQRAPCRQVYAHHLLLESDCGTAPGFDCPCDDSDDDDDHSFCDVPAITELQPAAGIDLLVISDDDPTLQALRTELSPDQPEIDGILGTGVMKSAQIDADYPHDRMLMRCAANDPTCTVRPELESRDDRAQVTGCIGGSGGGTIQ